MHCVKVLLLAGRDMLRSCKQGLKLHVARAQWKSRNQHNRTIANTVFPQHLVQVGQETYGHLNVHSYGHQGEQLSIGSCCSIAGDVHFILSGAHDYRRFTTFPFEAYYSADGLQEKAKGPIIVEDDVWIGYGVLILSGVRIGKGAVIAAGSIVSKDVPPYAIWIGNRVAKYRFAPEICEALQKVDLAAVDMNKAADSKLLMAHVSAENLDAVLSALDACAKTAEEQQNLK